jgi:integrase
MLGRVHNEPAQEIAQIVEQRGADYLGGLHGLRPTTAAAYRHALAPLRERYGKLPVQQLSKSHLDALITELTEQRGWSPNTTVPALNLMSRMLTDLVRQGALARDVAALVRRPKRPRARLSTFSADEARRVLAHVEGDRLGHAWHLALSGLRRGEIAGLLWSDVVLDGDGGTIAITRATVSVGGRVVDTDPKTEHSARTLPLTPELARSLRRARATQAAERLALGADYADTGRVVVDVAGRPYHPDTLSDFWRELCGAAGVRRIRLHDARHSCASLMHSQGVPIAVISAWLGHADPAFTMRTYVHASDDALAVAAAGLARIVGGAEQR